MKSKRKAQAAREVFAVWHVRKSELGGALQELRASCPMSCGEGDNQWSGFEWVAPGAGRSPKFAGEGRVEVRPDPARDRWYFVEYSARGEEFLRQAGRGYWLSPHCFEHADVEEATNWGVRRGARW